MSHADLIERLVARLRTENFQVGPDQILHALRIAAHLPVTTPEAEVQTFLGPIFVSSHEQQQRFAEIVRELNAKPVHPKLEERAQPPVRVHRLAWAGFLAITAVMSYLTIAIYLRSKDAASPASVSAVVEPGLRAVLRTVRVPALALSPLMLALLALTALALSTIVLILWREWEHHKQRHVKRTGPPYAWCVRSHAASLFDPDELTRLMRAMRGRWSTEVLRLDIRKTLAATVRAAGDPRFVYSAELRVPEYIALIERRSERDHQAAYFDELVKRVVEDGVVIKRYFFENDPRVFWMSSRHEAIRAAELHKRAPDARFILLGSGNGLWDPVSGAPNTDVLNELRWPVQIVVNLFGKSVRDGLGVTTVLSGFDALTELADHLLGYRVIAGLSTPRCVSGQQNAALLRQTMHPDTFRWLCACAAHPTLQWEITIALGVEVCRTALRDRLRELLCLSWFRDGEIPDARRAELLEYLEADEHLETIARTTILRLLEEPSLLPHSFAARERSLQILIHQIWLNRGHPYRLGDLYRQLRTFRMSEIGRDVRFVRLLLNAPGTRLARRISPRIRRLWFRFGIPALGRHDLTGAPAAVVTGSLVFLFAFSDALKTASGRTEIRQVTSYVSARSASALRPSVTPPKPAIASDRPASNDASGSTTTGPLAPPASAAQRIRLIAPVGIVDTGPSDTVRFRWSPPGRYRLVVDDDGTEANTLLDVEVSGSSYVWKGTPAEYQYASLWALQPLDESEAPPAVSFSVEPRMARLSATFDVTVVIDCAHPIGTRQIALEVPSNAAVQDVRLSDDTDDEGWEIQSWKQKTAVISYDFTKRCRDESSQEKTIRIVAHYLLAIR